MEVVRKKMLIKYWDDMYSIGHMALFRKGSFTKRIFRICFFF